MFTNILIYIVQIISSLAILLAAIYTDKVMEILHITILPLVLIAAALTVVITLVTLGAINNEQIEIGELSKPRLD